MYVDDNLLADVLDYLWPALAASIESLFILLGFPDESKRKVPLAIDKYIKTKCYFLREQLVLLLNTRTLLITMPLKKIEKAIEILQHPEYYRFVHREKRQTNTTALVKQKRISTSV